MVQNEGRKRRKKKKKKKKRTKIFVKKGNHLLFVINGKKVKWMGCLRPD